MSGHCSSLLGAWRSVSSTSIARCTVPRWNRQFFCEFERVEDPDRRQFGACPGVGYQGVDQLGPDFIDECPNRSDEGPREIAGGQMVDPPCWRDPLMFGALLELDAVGDVL